MSNEILTQARVKELFDYDGENLIRRVACWSAKAGDVVGKATGKYRRVTVDKKPYLVHRLIWLWVYGEWPNGDIDHLNGHGLDNRIENLRVVTPLMNQRNRKKQSNNSSGITGVCWHKQAGKWMARIKINRKYAYLGLFDCKYRAASTYELAKQLHGGYTSRHGK